MVLSVVGAALLACVHLFAGHLHTLVGSVRRPLYSVLSGVTTGYLFLKLLPGVSRGRALPVLGELPEDQAEVVFFGLALAGFVGYHAVEVWAWASPSVRGEAGRQAHVYRVHLGAFAAFNAAVAILLPHQLAAGLPMGALYVAVLMLHLLVLDHSLARLHAGRYGTVARVLHSSSLAIGLVFALIVGPLPPASLTDPLLAVLAGCLALQVIRMEIPASRQGHPAAFAFGALLFATVFFFAMGDSGRPWA